MQREFKIELFLERIEYLITEHCGGNRSQFNSIVGQRSADYRWRNEKRFPRVEALVRVCNYFTVSMDWLLGLDDHQTSQKTDDDAMPDEHLRELLNHYREVAAHYKNLYEHMRTLLEPLHFPQDGVGKKKETSRL